MSSALLDVWQIRHVGVPFKTEIPLEDRDNDCNEGKKTIIKMVTFFEDEILGW